jgi:hypothetical protein
MGALPKRRLSTGRKGRRRQDKNIDLKGRGQYVSSRDRRTAMRGEAETTEK